MPEDRYPTKVVIPPKEPLTFDQEKSLMDRVRERFESDRKDCGWEGKNTYSGWMLIRKQATDEFEGNFEHRVTDPKFGALFQNFNDSANVPREAIQIAKARICEQLLNSEPFAGLGPETKDDRDPAIDAMEELFQAHLKACKAKSEGRNGAKGGLIRGEGLMKITKLIEPHEEDKEGRIWMVPSELNDAQQPTKWQPIQDSKGGHVWHDDQWDQDPTDINGKRLRRDPAIIQPSGAQLSENPIKAPHSTTKWEMQMEKIPWSNFLCSPTASTIHKAESIHHVFDWGYDEVLAFMDGVPLSPEAEKFAENLRKGTVGVNDAIAPSTEAVQNRGERDRDGETGSNRILLCESWLRWVPDPRTGLSREMMVFWAIESQFPLSYEKMKLASHTGKRPIGVIRPLPVEDRWYGFGFYEFLKHEHDFVDRNLSRIDARESSAGRFTWIKEAHFPEIAAGIPLRLNDGRCHVVDEDVDDPSKSFGFVALPPMAEGIWKLYESALQTAKLLTGTMTPGDAAQSNLKVANDTATGANILQQTSDLLSGETLQDAKEGIEEILSQFTVALFSDFDFADAAERLGSEKAQLIQKWLGEHKLSEILHHVRLLLVKTRSRQQFQANQQAWTLLVGNQSWVDVVTNAPWMAPRLSSIVAAMLNSLDIQDADSIADYEAIQKDLAKWQQQQAAAQAAAGQQPGGAAPNGGTPAA